MRSRLGATEFLGTAGTAAALLLALALPGEAHTTAAATSTTTFSASADARVEAGTPDVNYGTATRLGVDGSPNIETYLRFDVTGITGPVASAKLRVYATDGTSNGPAVYASPSGWSETGITWNSRPGRTGLPSDDRGAMASNAWVEWDVTPLVTGSGTVGFALIPTSTDGVTLNARNATGNRPELVVTYSAAPPPPPPPPDTTPPAVAISEPAAGSTYTTAQTVAITAAASDDVGVTRVEFLDNGVVARSVTTPPWSYPWSFAGADNGPHRWTARAYDDAGNAAESAPVDVRVEIPPAETTYYVDAGSGNDASSGTSESDAWRTLARASSASLAPGDRLLLKRRVVFSGTLELTESGTDEKRIEVGGYGSGEEPLITGAESCVRLRGAYLTVTGLHLQNCDWAGVDVSGSYARVDRSLLTFNAAGVHIRPGAYGTVVLGNEFRDNNKMSRNTPGGDDDSGAFGILIEGDNSAITRNTISGSDAFSYDYGRDGSAIEIYGGQNNEITYNVALENQAFAELGGSRTADNVFAFNETRSSLATAIAFVTRGAANAFGPVGRSSLYNNTIVYTGSSSRGVICGGGCGPEILRMRGNIVQSVGNTLEVDAPFDEDYNLFHGGPVTIAPGPHSLVADPQFVDAGAGNLRLKESSPAIDAGTDADYQVDLDGVQIPQDGDGDGVGFLDIGAHEFVRVVIRCAPATYTFEPIADAEVHQASPNTNYGGATSLRSDLDYTGGHDAEPLFRFDVTGVPEGCTVASATLRAYVTNGVSGNGPYAQATAGSWSEQTVTWNTKPALVGAALGNAGVIGTNVWANWDVTAAVAGNGAYSFVLKPESSDGMAVHSRENTNKPTLVVTTAAG